ncbi:MAG TPA: nicotinate phosphoribosyltransferase [Candidatus Polarisedimenticolia bacterium]|nr:nicotinate phosphoribosyltransferase [Candidatus Polarisedimenticolia bacterium]
MSHALLVDLYELTMAAGYLRRGMLQRPAAFDLSFRRTPFGGGYAVFAGLEPALDHLVALRFGGDELRYLQTLGLFDDRFLSWLGSVRFSGRVTAVAEGEVVFGGEPLLTVEGLLGECQIVETALLNLVNFQTLVATKAARVCLAAGGSGVVEFGARRAHGPDGALGATRAAFIGGAAATSHLQAGRSFGIPVSGTQAHSWVMAFPTELEAFRAYAEAFPDQCTLLVDTYDTLRSGVPNAVTVARELRAAGHELRGIRLDSGDLAYLSRQARRMLDDAGFPGVGIVASNELDEQVIESVRKEGGRVNLYGVGTQLVTGGGEEGGALGGVYKLVELDGGPRVKVSSDPAKSSIPGRKRLWRAMGRGASEADGRFQMDVLSAAEETPAPGDLVVDPANPMRTSRVPRGAELVDLRCVVMDEGRRCGPSPALAEAASRARESLKRLPEGTLRLLNPHRYRVALTRRLHALRARMIDEARAPGAPP